jgi:hypothetical protein
VVRSEPKAEELRADEADREQPEEEAIGEAAGEQAAAERELPLDRTKPGVGPRHALPRGRGQLVRALHERGHAGAQLGVRLRDGRIL